MIESELHRSKGSIAIGSVQGGLWKPPPVGSRDWTPGSCGYIIHIALKLPFLYHQNYFEF